MGGMGRTGDWLAAGITRGASGGVTIGGSDISARANGAGSAGAAAFCAGGSSRAPVRPAFWV
jgi:hypothetical protein